MKKTKAVVLGCFTVLPIAYFIFFITFFIRTFFTITNSSFVDNTEHIFGIIVPMHISIMILIIVLMIIYIKNVFNNSSIEADKRSLWAIVLFFGNTIAMLIYWYLKIWKPIKKKESEI